MELLSFKTPLLCSGFFNGGQSLSARLGITSQGLNGGAPAQEAFESIVCKANDKERRKAQRAGKTQELVRKREEIGRKREEALVKSRGGQQLTKKENEETVENLEYLLLADVGGAMSVGVLQLREEEEIPVGSLRVKDFPRQISMSTKETQSFDSISTQSVKNSAPLSPSVSKAESGSCGALLDEFKAMNSKLAEEIVDSIDAATDDSEEDWIEVEVDEVEDEDVELWEGDLPPMTAAEEEELLREAEIELAELEKAAQLCKNKEVISSEHELGAETEDSGFDFEEEVPTEKSEMEKKLAELKNLVKQMEEELATEAVANDNVTESPSAVDGSLDHAKKRKKAGLSDIARTKNSTDGDWEVAYEMAVSKKDVSRMRASETNIRLGSPEKSEYKEWDDEEDEVEKVKERGIPAVMRCFDRAKIYVKAGNGGNGVVAFRREKFVPFGGPAGGNGGRGGHVYIEADSSMNSLLPFRNRVHFRAGRGSHGGGKSKEGAVGTDIVVKVPPGTIIREAGPDGKVLLELTKAGQRQTLLPGGAGGRGNVAFKTGRNNAPQLAEFGEEGVEMWVELELKLVADVGIVGVPNAGKSTLLSAISAAKPEIANYPFTTLLPNLGVVALDYDAAIVVADLPGLLEGAHSGVGLGHEFLRHTERCRVLVHVVDGMSLQPVEEYQAVRLELQLFNPVFADKPHVVAFNKMDIPEAAERWESFQANLRAKGVEPLCMSAATGEGTQEVIRAAHVFVRAQDRETKEVNTEEEKAMEVADMVRKQKSAPIEEFTIVADKHTRTWQVNGAGLERFTQMTNWEYFEAVKRFQHVLVASGVNKALRTQGVKEGDTVVVGQFEFQWIDSEDMANLGEWKRGVRGSKVWPH